MAIRHFLTVATTKQKQKKKHNKIPTAILRCVIDSRFEKKGKEIRLYFNLHHFI